MRIFWNIKQAFMGIPLILPITQQALMVPVGLIATLYATQYLITSSVYYDQYDGEVYETDKRV